MKFFLFFSFNLLFFTCSSQTTTVNPFQHQIILRHYSAQELQSIQQTDSVKFNAICYYYTQSFIFKSKKCNVCPLVTAQTFDVSEFEYMRKKTMRFTRHFEKYGYEITFLSIDELQYKLPIHSAN